MKENDQGTGNGAAPWEKFDEDLEGNCSPVSKEECALIAIALRSKVNSGESGDQLAS